VAIVVKQVKVAVPEVAAAKAVVAQHEARLHQRVKEMLAVEVVLILGMRLEVAVVAVLLIPVVILALLNRVVAVMEQWHLMA
jgi:hypothetical protein